MPIVLELTRCGHFSPDQLELVGHGHHADSHAENNDLASAEESL